MTSHCVRRRPCFRWRREVTITISDDCDDHNDDDARVSSRYWLQFLTVICVIAVLVLSNFTCSNTIVATAASVIVCKSNHRLGAQQQQQHTRHLRQRDESATIKVISWEDEADYYLPPPGPIEDDDDDATNVFADTKDDDKEDVMDDVVAAGIIYSEDNIGSKETPAPQPFDAVTFEINEDLAETSHKMKDQSFTLQEYNNDIAEAEVELEAEYRESRIKNNNTQLTTSSVFDIHFGKAVYADTIFDDLLRGFIFAASFCFIIICLYNCCTKLCTRIGCLPDERVLLARLHRLRLRKKRMYLAAGADANSGNYGDEGYDEGLPPLDTRKWGEWMARRAGVHTAADDVWNDGVDTPWEEDDNNNDDDDDDEERPLNENNRRVVTELEMAELEYGEGEELEDKSHDSRLFDDEDEGEGARREAEQFFGDDKKKKTTNVVSKNVGESHNKGIKSSISDHNKVRANAKTFLQKANKKEVKRGVAAYGGGKTNRKSSNESLTTPPQKTISDDAFFSEMRRPTTDNSGNNLPQSQSSAATLDDSFVKRKFSQDKDENVGHGDDQEDIDNDDDSDCGIHEDDRGYDLENDLLGLRSDSPEPLDLEQIEKKLISDMENAKKEGYLCAR